MYFKCPSCQRYTLEEDYCPHCHSSQKSVSCPLPEKLYYFTCGCCGSYYQSFNLDSEFDHDIGYGECPKCHDWIVSKNEKEFDKMFSEIERGLSAKNLEKWSKISRDKKKDFAIGLMDEGIISISIKPTITS